MAVKEIKYNNKVFLINYDIINNSKDEVIVFLHGWGSNKEIMKTAFQKELKDYKHIYLDMPGFGRSLTNQVLTTNEYAKIVNQFLISLNISSTISTIVGHSFGGKVATLLNPKRLVLLSSAGIVEPKSLVVKLKIAFAKFLNIFGLGKLTKAFRSQDVQKMSQNMYETFKNVVDEDFRSEFEKFENSCMIFWGESDTSTSLKSGKTISSLIKNSTFKSYYGDHYFFLKHNKDIASRIESK